MKGEHLKTLEAVFHKPILSSLVWKDVENMLLSLNAEITEGAGSRIRIKLNSVRAIFLRPHPKKEIDKGALISLRRFLENAGVKP